MALLQNIPPVYKNEECSVVGSPIQIYNKLSVNGKIIYSTDAKGSTNHNSTNILFRPTLPPYNLQYGQVVRFLVCPSSHQCDSALFAVVKALRIEPYRELDKLSMPDELSHVKHLLVTDFVSVQGIGELLAVPVESIMNICFDVSVDDASLLCSLIGQERAI